MHTLKTLAIGVIAGVMVSVVPVVARPIMALNVSASRIHVDGYSLCRRDGTMMLRFNTRVTPREIKLVMNVYNGSGGRSVLPVRVASTLETPTRRGDVTAMLLQVGKMSIPEDVTVDFHVLDITGAEIYGSQEFR